MNEVMATCPEDVVASLETELRARASAEASAQRAMAGAGLEAMMDDPPPPDIALPLSDPEDAIGLIRRGVRVAPVAETTPLLPLYEAHGRDLPAELRVAAEQQNYEFYLVALTFSLRLEDNESPDHAEFAVKVRDGVTGPRASRAVEVFPQRVHTSFFKAEGQISVALEASMKFAVGLDGLPGLPGQAQAGGDAAAGAKAIVGPFTIDVGQTELDVSGEGDRDIGWIYRVRRALEGKNDFKSFLVLKVAKETPKVDLLANIGVRTYRRTWRTLWLREKLPILYARAMLEVELTRRG